MMIVGRGLVTFGIPSEEDVRIDDRQFHMTKLHIVKVKPVGKPKNGK